MLLIVCFQSAGTWLELCLLPYNRCSVLVHWQGSHSQGLTVGGKRLPVWHCCGYAASCGYLVSFHQESGDKFHNNGGFVPFFWSAWQKGCAV